MNYEIISALIIFSFVSSITPGPNNLMLMSSGVNFGFKRTLPHMFGVAAGFTLMVVLVGLGIMQVFDIYPLSYQILKVISVSYLFYLAYKIATSGAITATNAVKVAPMTFLQAALFQWVNPKAWTMALTAISVYAPSKSVSAIMFVALVFGMVNLPCISCWAILGQQMQRLLSSYRRLRIFNFSMALLLVLSLYPVIL